MYLYVCQTKIYKLNKKETTNGVVSKQEETTSFFLSLISSFSHSFLYIGVI
jgi:hypothetical protein